MKILNGIPLIQQLSAQKQRRFERFYTVQCRFRLLPLFSDLSLAMSIVGTVVFLLSEKLAPSWELKSAMAYLYAVMLILLAGLHRHIPALRHSPPMIVYLVFFHMALFNYLGYIQSGATIEPIIGLHIFISSLGFITLSFKHSLIIVLLDLSMLAVATALAVDSQIWGSTLVKVLTNWVVLMSLIIALLSALFNRWLFRNIIALQFLLNDRNSLLTKTLQSLKQTEDALVQQQKHQALSHMAKGLLHEIMNPVNCATQAMQFASSVNHDEEVGEALTDAISQQQRIAAIVKDLIDFSSPRPEHAPEQVPLLNLVENAQRLCRAELKSITVQVVENHPVMLCCYPSAITQVLVNLMLNAAAAVKQKYPQSGGELKIEWVPDMKLIKIRLTDNGKGIAPESLPRLGAPFFSTKNSPENLGLGLSICETILRHHQGHMHFHSEEGSGTEVTLTLPANPFNLDDNVAEVERCRAGS